MNFPKLVCLRHRVLEDLGSRHDRQVPQLRKSFAIILIDHVLDAGGGRERDRSCSVGCWPYCGGMFVVCAGRYGKDLACWHAENTMNTA
jgi:hypothetical protein